jgi:hypothetical protein
VFVVCEGDARIVSAVFLSSPTMHLNKKFLQRAFLAFTTGLFLACAARVSAAQTRSHADAAVTR